MALVGLPSQFNGATGFGSIGFNIGKLYGKIQLSHLFANWKQGKISFHDVTRTFNGSLKYINYTKNLIIFCSCHILVYTEAFVHYEDKKALDEYKGKDAYGYQPIYIVQKE